MGGHRFSFENLAKLDDPRRRRRQPPERLVEALELKPDATVLDIGVGAGYFALPIAEALAALNGDGTVIGLDAEPRMLEEFVNRARKIGVEQKIRTVETSESDGSPLPIEDDSVDIALMGFLYHELDQPRAYLEQVFKILRPGGRLFVVDWSPDHNLDFGPPPHHRIPPDEVTTAMNGAGFADVRPLSTYEGYYVIEGKRA